MKEIEDNFGNKIRVGDFVFLKRGVMKRAKVSDITRKGVRLEGVYPNWSNINLVVKDNTQELFYLHDLLEDVNSALPAGLEGLIGVSLESEEEE